MELSTCEEGMELSACEEGMELSTCEEGMELSACEKSMECIGACSKICSGVSQLRLHRKGLAGLKEVSQSLEMPWPQELGAGPHSEGFH
jgi:hypothetical protein